MEEGGIRREWEKEVSSLGEIGWGEWKREEEERGKMQDEEEEEEEEGKM